MKKKWLKKSSAILLSLTMVLSLFPGMNGTIPTVQAAEKTSPESAYWTDVSGLKSFSLDETSDTEGRIIFGQNGSGAAQQWKIAGIDSGINGDNIILFAASPLGSSAFQKEYNTNKPYDPNWNCTYPDGTIVSEVFPNHYGVSDLRAELNTYMRDNSYFSESEKTKMNQTTIYTDDKNNSTTYSVTDILYAPYGDYYRPNDKYVTVGTNTSDKLNGGVMINISKWGNDIFWLRSPSDTFESKALVVCQGQSVCADNVEDINSLVPAFDLNLSDVSFASAAEAASSSYSGFKANDTDNTMTANTYTLRYKSSGNEEAVISLNGTEINVKNANEKYLMVQNNNGVYALKIDSDNQTINASDIQMGSAESDKLANFNNCKVWLESTNADRITTAKMAVTTINSIEITDITAPVAGSAFDTEAACATTGVSTTTPTVTWIHGGESVTGNAGYNTKYTASVTLTAKAGYEFASNVKATMDGKAASVTKNQDGITVSYSYKKTAPKAVSNAYFATVDDLKDCYNIGDGAIGRIRFGLKKSGTRLWAICGAEGSNLALLSTSAFESATYGNTSEYSQSNFVTGMDKYLTSDYFSKEEKEKMADVTVKTNEYGNGGYEEKTVTDKKLYLPNTKDQYSYMSETIYVGSCNDIPINIPKLKDVTSLKRNFWLRSPYFQSRDDAHVAYPGEKVYRCGVDADQTCVVPAFNLKLSYVSFASAAEAATSSYTGYKANDTDNTMTANTYTLRYASAGTEEAVISPNGTKIEVKGAKGKYLMVQNNNGVYVLAIDNDSLTVNASDIVMGSAASAALTNFNNCKVWLESTDAGRITTAKMATQATVTTINSIEITDITSPVAGSTFDTEAACATKGVSTKTPTVTWTPNDTTAGYNTTYTASVTLTAEDGYEFASNVTATIDGKAASVTKNQNEITVSYSYKKTAPKAVSNAYFATVDDLKDCYNISDGKTIGKIKFGLNGSDARLWAICGKDGNNLALLSTSEFAKAAYGDTSAYSTSNFVTGMDKYLTLDYFSIEEKTKMADVTVKTNEPKGKGGNEEKTVTNKLYLPNSKDQKSNGQTTIYVGSSNDIAIDVTKLNDVGLGNLFWLRSPYDDISYYVLLAQPGKDVHIGSVNGGDTSVVPAFNLNLSDVSFASAAEAATSTGYKANSEMTANTYTLRYESSGSETAVVNAAGSQVAITNATDNMYLVVQNSAGAYTKELTSSTTSVSASDIEGLDNFNNCKVWLESTDEYRITTAMMATQETADVTITPASNMTKTSESGAENQTGITGAMKDVVYEANSGYYFTDDYVSTISGLTDGAINGIKVTRDSLTQITVSGAPTAKSTTIALADPMKKEAASTPTIEIDYVNETLTGFDTATEYSINDGAAFTPTLSTIPIDDSYYGNTIKIKKTETDTALASAEQSLDIPARPAAPAVTGTDETVDGKNDGTITGVDDTMEYSMSMNGPWTACIRDAVDGTISKLGVGTYYVRKAATTTSFVGEITTVTIGKGVPVKKVLSVTAPTFDTVTEGYTRPEAKKITIKNDTAGGSNWEATVSDVTLTGTDADKFEVMGSGYDWTIQPKSDLTANTDGTAKTYTAIINVAYDATEGVTSPAIAEVSFTVNPKSNTVTVTSGTLDNGSTTGNFNKGATVTVKADSTPSGYKFAGWTGTDGLTLLDGTTSTSETIKFTMPEEAVNITATYKDIAAPSATIHVKTNTWNSILNKITFGHFFKNTQDVTITGTDNESGVDKIEYILSEKELSEDELKAVTDWTSYTDKFSINPGRKYVIYAKVTDNAGNFVIVNSNGIVVYEDSAQDTTAITHIKGVDGDQTAKVKLNGNTVKAINDGSKTLVSGKDYTVAGDGTITFNEDYLESLAVKDTPYTLTVSYNPMGESYVAGKGNDEPATTTLEITVRKPRLNSITAPSSITGVANGTDKTAEALGLPSTVTISTEDNAVTTANVNWDLTKFADGSYDKTVLTEQTFTVNGTVTLPDTIDANGKSLKVTIKITVDAAPYVEKVSANPVAGSYTENQNVTLSTSTEGAEIYYTTDGSTPDKTNGTKYTGAISVTGTEGKDVTTVIKAVAVKDGMQDSEVQIFEYKISIPDTAVAPGITTQPTDATVVEGNKATFTVVATGTPEPTYQWQIDRNDGNGFVNIDGATSASYTTSAMVKANDGYKCRCVVTNRKGSVTSNEATLTVTDAPVTTYTVTVTTDGNGTALANVTSAAFGTKITLTATAKEGYQFKEWQVVSGGVYIKDNTFTMPANDVSVKAVFEKKAAGDDDKDETEYKIIFGANGSWTQNTDDAMTISGNGEFSKFVTVKVDGTEVSKENYTAKSGSTIITFKKEYLNTLSAGTHTCEIVWTDGSASTTFTIKATTPEKTDDNTSDNTTGTTTDKTNETKQTSTKTGDNTPIMLYVLVLLGSGLGIAGVAVASKKRKRNTQ